MSYLVANPEDRFSRDEAQLIPGAYRIAVYEGGANANERQLGKGLEIVMQSFYTRVLLP